MTPSELRRTAAYWYDLPEERIAKTPAQPRDAARLLILAPMTNCFEDRLFTAFPTLLGAGDVLVINETRVMRARLRATRESGGAAEILLLRPATHERFDPSARRWHALVKPGRRLRPGARLHFGDAGTAEIIAITAQGIREIALDIRLPFEEFLERYGEMPLPPYVGPGNEARAAGYQTVFARVPGSIAAPTASLHFSATVLDTLRNRGVTIVPVVLDVGLGTFKPIETENIDDHVMHTEHYAIPSATAATIRCAKREGRRVVAAGTTVLRTLETCAQRHGEVIEEEGESSLFVTPGFRFRVVDALLTNFHLPGSTLLVLLCAFAGYERAMSAYRHAREAGYRFYSFGDAMFVERGREDTLITGTF